MSSQLLQWLSEQEDSGAHDSEGSFSLRADRAWEKLGAFQLPFEEAWVLKLVQAAVGMGATELKVSQSWEDTRLRFVGCRLEQADVEEAVFDTPQYLGPGLQHLGTAIRALAKGTEQPFSLCFGQERDQVWTGKRFVARSWIGGRPCKDFSVTVAHFKRGDITTIWSVPSTVLRKKVASIFQTLCHTCYTSPIKLSVDGRMVNGVHSDPTFGLKRTTRPLALLQVSEEQELPALELIQGRDWRRSRASDLQVRLNYPQLPICPTVVSAGAWVLVSAFLGDDEDMSRPLLRNRDEAAQLLWVSDGAIVERENLDFRGALSFSAMVSAKGLDTDLTGLSLRKNQAYQNRRDAALQGVGVMISQNRESLNQAAVVLEHEHPMLRILDSLDPVLKFVRPIFGDSFWLSKNLRLEQRKKREKNLQSAFRSVCGYLEALAP